MSFEFCKKLIHSNNMLILDLLLKTSQIKALWLLRLLLGTVFLSEGVQKFLFSDSLGVGRFTEIGLPSPDILAPLVACLEISCGLLLLLGLLTRLAVIPLIFIMLTAILTTKIPILLDSGFWKMAHESRTDFSMLCISLFLLIHGSGAFSADNKFLQPLLRRGKSHAL